MTSPDGVEISGSPKVPAWAVWTLCGLICALGWTLRSRHLDWGVPGLSEYRGKEVGFLHPDEWAVVEQVERVVQSGNPFDLRHPKYGPAHALLVAPMVRAAGVDAEDEPGLYLACRRLSVIAGTLSILVLFLAGARFHPVAGLSASLFYAVAMVPARDAHWADPDSLCAFFVLSTIYLGLRSLRNPTTAGFLAGGVCLGLGVATKAFAVFFVPIPFLVSFLVVRRDPPVADHGERDPEFFTARGFIRGLEFFTALAALTALALLTCREQALRAGRAVLEYIYRSNSGGTGHGKPLAFWFDLLESVYPLILKLVLAASFCLVLFSAAAVLISRRHSFREPVRRLRFLLYRKAWVFVGAFLLTSIPLLGACIFFRPVDFFFFLVHHANWAGTTGKFGLFPACASIPTYAGSLLPVALGWPLYMAALAGMLLGVWRREDKDLFALGSILPFFSYWRRTTITPCVFHFPFSPCSACSPAFS